MREDKKRARSKSKLAELFGMEAPDNPKGPTAARIHEDSSREAEGVLDFLARPNSYIEKNCRRCHKPFMVNRANVALCSDYCREKELADVGIGWRWDRSPAERWYFVYDGDKRNTEPLVIGPEATKVLKDNEEAIKMVPQEIIEEDDDFLYGFDSENTA